LQFADGVFLRRIGPDIAILEQRPVSAEGSVGGGR
jgi:hypothetical protein